MKFEVGDVVRLKSGGPLMTVSDTTGVDNVHCCWLNANDEFTGAWMKEGMLELVDDDIDGFYDAGSALSDEELTELLDNPEMLRDALGR